MIDSADLWDAGKSSQWSSTEGHANQGPQDEAQAAYQIEKIDREVDVVFAYHACARFPVRAHFNRANRAKK